MQTFGSSHRYQSNKMVKMSDITRCCALNLDFQLLKARFLYIITMTNSTNLNPPSMPCLLLILRAKTSGWYFMLALLCLYIIWHFSGSLEHKIRESISWEHCSGVTVGYFCLNRQELVTTSAGAVRKSSSTAACSLQQEGHLCTANRGTTPASMASTCFLKLFAALEQRQPSAPTCHQYPWSSEGLLSPVLGPNYHTVIFLPHRAPSQVHPSVCHGAPPHLGGWPQLLPRHNYIHLVSLSLRYLHCLFELFLPPLILKVWW